MSITLREPARNPDAPCDDCGSDQNTSRRYSGKRWGFGFLCKRCYDRHYSRDRRGPDAPGRRTNPTCLCARCGTDGGTLRGEGVPRRKSGARWGLGLLCRACYRHFGERDQRVARALTAVVARPDRPNTPDTDLPARIDAIRGLQEYEMAVRQQLALDAVRRPAGPPRGGQAFLAAVTAPLYGRGVA